MFKVFCCLFRGKESYDCGFDKAGNLEIRSSSKKSKSFKLIDRDWIFDVDLLTSMTELADEKKVSLDDFLSKKEVKISKVLSEFKQKNVQKDFCEWVFKNYDTISKIQKNELGEEIHSFAWAFLLSLTLVLIFIKNKFDNYFFLNKMPWLKTKEI